MTALVSEVIHGVFVSSTYNDLREERAAVQKALLTLGCFPIGMELFGSADAETWEFIKRQIDACDYYVVIIAGRYGSLADDGLSFTEKEYEYARSTGKPCLVFAHINPDSLPRNATEVDLEKQKKLGAFLERVKSRPVSFFGNADELARQVATSFVNERQRNPRPGYVRADTIMDPKKYADLVNENRTLRSELEDARARVPLVFQRADDPLVLHVSIIAFVVKNQTPARQYRTTYGLFFVRLADVILNGEDELGAILPRLAGEITGSAPAIFADDRAFEAIKRLAGWGLVRLEKLPFEMSPFNGVSIPAPRQRIALTDAGMVQYGLLMP